MAWRARLSAPSFAGAILVAYLPDDASMEPVLDHHSGCFSTARWPGPSALTMPGARRGPGPGELLMFAHPLHLRLLADGCGARVLDDFRYWSIDGVLGPARRPGVPEVALHLRRHRRGSATSYGDAHLVSVGATLTALEMLAARWEGEGGSLLLVGRQQSARQKGSPRARPRSRHPSGQR
ncbi:hypothetical protein BS78_07G015700 [Paspalum vaginatum]|nr:hypothetical protein BS78_07G015700 [Paspalum vaginatum]